MFFLGSYIRMPEPHPTDCVSVKNNITSSQPNKPVLGHSIVVPFQNE